MRTHREAEKVRTLYPSAHDLRKQWADPALRAEIIAKLEERGIDFDQFNIQVSWVGTSSPTSAYAITGVRNRNGPVLTVSHSF